MSLALALLSSANGLPLAGSPKKSCNSGWDTNVEVKYNNIPISGCKDTVAMLLNAMKGYDCAFIRKPTIEEFCYSVTHGTGHSCRADGTYLIHADGIINCSGYKTRSATISAIGTMIDGRFQDRVETTFPPHWFEEVFKSQKIPLPAAETWDSENQVLTTGGPEM